MNEFVIVTDSTCDLAQPVVDRIGVTVIPMEFSVDDKTYLNYPDERALSSAAFYNMLRGGACAKTSQITVRKYMDVFGSILAQDRDVLYLCFSSALSGSFDSANVAARELSSSYPLRRVYIVDTRAASLGEGLFVVHAAEKKKDGCTIEELRAWAEENRDSYAHWFTVDDLQHLKRGGRITSASAALGTLLSVKPVLCVDRLGQLIFKEKAHGRKKALHKLAEKMEASCTEPETQTVFISHADCAADAEYLAQLVRSRLPVKDIMIGHTGPVIGSHTGPGMVGLYYRGSK